MEDSLCNEYIAKITAVIRDTQVDPILVLARSLQDVCRENHQVFLCGNGGSAANAVHIAEDLFYCTAKSTGKGVRAHALPANQSILTCIANDDSYEEIFSRQLAVLAQPDDVLIVLSGSGNSPNVVNALKKAKEMGLKTFAILGYGGGKCLTLADVAIHFPVDDMQIAEDCQQIVGHMLARWLENNST